MMVLLLIGCLGTLHSSEGSDKVRGALWFAGREGQLNGSEVGDDATDTPNEGMVLLANSQLPCAPEKLEDDPETGLDEAAASQMFWQAQVQSAFAREGAIIVLLGLYTWSDGLSGEYTISADALQDHLTLLEDTPRVGFGAWMRVNEAAVEESNGLFSTYTDTDVDYEAAATTGSAATVDVLGSPDDEVADGERLKGAFNLEPSGMSGEFRADRCDNMTLYTAVLAQVVALQYLLD